MFQTVCLRWLTAGLTESAWDAAVACTMPGAAIPCDVLGDPPPITTTQGAGYRIILVAARTNATASSSGLGMDCSGALTLRVTETASLRSGQYIAREPQKPSCSQQRMPSTVSAKIP